jgi:hypothetical protein
VKDVQPGVLEAMSIRPQLLAALHSNDLSDLAEIL